MAQNQSGFYRGLRRLFSNNVIVRYVGKKKIKVVDTDGFQMSNKRGEKYSRMKTYSQLEQGAGGANGSMDRQTLYNDYMEMDRDPILSSALDLYSEESTTKDEFDDVLSITTNNKNIERTLHNLFYDILNIDFNLWGWIRNMCKFGDAYLYLELHKDLGVINVKILSPYDVDRIEGEDEKNPYLVQFVVAGDEKDMLEEFQVAHFRLLGDVFHYPYGRSMLEGGRKIWQQITLMEDAMIIHRIMRAPEKRIFKIDVGALSPDEVDSHMETIISGMKKVPFINPQTGEYNLKFNMMNINEDFFFPVRGGDSGTEVDTLSGMEYAVIDDIEYLQRKLFASLRIPKAFLSYEEEIGSKATLAAEDLRFARTIERLQRIVVSELTKIGIIHLYAQGYKNKDLLNFELTLTNPSIVHEELKIELWNSKVSLARDMVETNMLSSDFVYEQIFKLSDEEKEKERLRVLEDKKRLFRWEQIEQEGKDPADPNSGPDEDDDGFSWDGDEEEDDGDGNVEEKDDTPETEGTKKRSTKQKKNLDDLLGVTDMKDGHKYDKSAITHKYKGGSALSLEGTVTDVFEETDREIQALEELRIKRLHDKYGFLTRYEKVLGIAKGDTHHTLLKEVIKGEKDKKILK